MEDTQPEAEAGRSRSRQEQEQVDAEAWDCRRSEVNLLCNNKYRECTCRGSEEERMRIQLQA